MNKKELIAAAVDLLKENDIRKPVTLASETFRVTQESTGDDAAFTVRRKDKQLSYTHRDVQNILDVLLCLAEDAVKRGEPINIRGFGTLETKHVAARRVREPQEEIWHDIPECFRPKFRPGFQLLAAARAHGLLMADDDPNKYLPPPVDDDPEEDDY